MKVYRDTESCCTSESCSECGLCSTTRYVRAGSTEPNKEDSNKERKDR